MTGLCGCGPGLDADAEIGSQDLAGVHGKQPLLANGARVALGLRRGILGRRGPSTAEPGW